MSRLRRSRLTAGRRWLREPPSDGAPTLAPGPGVAARRLETRTWTRRRGRAPSPPRSRSGSHREAPCSIVAAGTLDGLLASETLDAHACRRLPRGRDAERPGG